MSIEAELDLIKTEMKKTPDLAWGWHCNIACASQDQGLSHEASNKAAANFMKSAFEVEYEDYAPLELVET